MIKTNLVKRIRVVQEFLVVGTANSTSESYWDRDFAPLTRIPVGKPEETIVERLRVLTDAEQALLGYDRGAG